MGIQVWLIVGIMALTCGLTQDLALAADQPREFGLAELYPGDVGLANDPHVVFAENFENGDLKAIAAKWGDISNENEAVMLTDDVPEGSSGTWSLSITAKRGQNNGGHLFTVLPGEHDQLFLRFYVKFAPDYGINHHFVKLQGAINPPPWPMGGAGEKPTTSFSTGIEPNPQSLNSYPAPSFAPPGVWSFYTYWPDMRSWQNTDGTPDPRNPQYYGNTFFPREPVTIPRGEWICVEIMVKLNSETDAFDGAQAMWINGRLVADFRPGGESGYWMRDQFRNDPTNVMSTPFPGFRWRTDMQVHVNKLHLQNYVTDQAFATADAYLAQHPEYLINTQQATVWFDDLVVATEYIGPRQPVR